VGTALWMGTAEAGIFRHRHVTTVAVRLDTGPARDGEAIPGHPIPLTVTLTDRRGNQRVTEGAKPRLLWRKLQVDVEGGRFDPERAAVVPDPANGRTVQRLQSGRLAVTVTPTKSRSAASSTLHSLDWRAVHGPLASEVKQVSLSAHGAELMDNHWLLPGTEVQVTGLVVDDRGRTYRTDQGPVRIPWARLALTTQGLTDQGSGRLKADRSRNTAPYRIKLGMPEAAVATFHTEWVRDWERIDGPEPKAITTMSMSLEVSQDTPDGELVPGAVTPVLIEATTLEGRTFTTKRGARLALPSSRLVVRPTHGSWSPSPQTIAWSSDLRSMVGKTYDLQVAYVDRPDTRMQAVWQPDFLHPLKPWRTSGDHATVASDALEGSPGRPGEHGSDGVDARSRRRGTDGGDGGDAGSGAAGRPGHSLILTAWTTATLDGRHEVVVYVLDGPDGRSVHTILPGQGRVRVHTQGGAGGHGGHGGHGGDAGHGASACRPGRGGDGGRGGRGGDGGDGGDGGNIQVYVDHPATAHRFELDSLGGPGGEGGTGGNGGEPGRAGSVVTPPHIEGQASPACAEATSGDTGMRGPPGPNGPNGPNGRVDVRIDRFAVQAAKTSLPSELREALP